MHKRPLVIKQPQQISTTGNDERQGNNNHSWMTILLFLRVFSIRGLSLGKAKKRMAKTSNR